VSKLDDASSIPKEELSDPNGDATAYEPSLLVAAIPESSFPIDSEWFAFMPGIADYRSLARIAYDGWQVEISRCMKRSGFDYTPIEFVDPKNVDFYRAMNPLNEDAAREWAFHVPRTEEVVDQNLRNDKPYLRALNGSDDGLDVGCAGTSSMSVYGPLELVTSAYEAVSADLTSRLGAYVALPEAESLRASWSSCMSGLGYRFNDFEDAYAVFSERPLIETDERTARTASVSCDRTTARTERRSDWERAVFEQWLGENSEVFNDINVKMLESSDALSAVLEE
jgi:hypothetical protein